MEQLASKAKRVFKIKKKMKSKDSSVINGFDQSPPTSPENLMRFSQMNRIDKAVSPQHSLSRGSFSPKIEKKPKLKVLAKDEILKLAELHDNQVNDAKQQTIPKQLNNPRQLNDSKQLNRIVLRPLVIHTHESVSTSYQPSHNSPYLTKERIKALKPFNNSII